MSLLSDACFKVPPMVNYNCFQIDRDTTITVICLQIDSNNDGASDAGNRVITMTLPISRLEIDREDMRLKEI